MTQAEFIGSLIISAGTVLGAFVIVVRPMLSLNTSMVKLGASVDVLNDNLKRQEDRITKHSGEIDEMKKDIIELKVKNKKG